MELLQLQYFKTIAECQHITKAANKLMVSQPSLSNTLARIENELGVRLFDRQGRNIVLNSYGEIVLRHANNILREIDNIRAEIDDLEHQKKKTLTIASNNALYVMEWLPFFLSKNDDLNVRHSIMTTEQIKEGLLNGTIDFGITTTLENRNELNHLPLYDDHYIVLVPKGHPLDDQVKRKFSDFKDAAFVARSSAYNVARAIDELCACANFIPNIIFESETEFLRTIFIPLKALLITMHSTIRTQEELDMCKEVCTIVELTDPFSKITATLSWDKKRYLSAAAQRLLDHMQQHPIQKPDLDFYN